MRRRGREAGKCCSGSQRRKGFAGGCGERDLSSCLRWPEKNEGGPQRVSSRVRCRLGREVTSLPPSLSSSSIK